MDSLASIIEAPTQLPTFMRSKRLLQNHSNLAQWAQLILSALLMAVLLAGIAFQYTDTVSVPYRYLSVISLLLILIVYNFMGIYRRFTNKVNGLQQLAKAWAFVIGVLVAAGFVTKTTTDYSRLVIVLWVGLGFCIQAMIYLSTYSISRRVRARNKNSIPTLVVGAGALGQHLVEAIEKNAWLPDRIVGTVEDDAILRSKWSNQKVPIVGNSTQLLEVISSLKVRRVYIALPVRHSELIEEIQSQLLGTNVDVIWAPDIFHLNLINHSVRELAGVPLISLSESPITNSTNALIKSAFDKVIALAALIALAPLMALAATLIKLTSSGPVLFKQKRDGWDGRVIEVWKFRSMYVHQESEGRVTQAKVNDHRVTPIGRFLRRTSIDELPQLFNVLQGAMSLVGPRPHALAHNQSYSKKIDSYLSRHRIKPGITGLAQIKGLRGETENLDKMQKRVIQDIEYIRNWSIWLDLKILLLTPVKLFSKNAY